MTRDDDLPITRTQYRLFVAIVLLGCFSLFVIACGLTSFAIHMLLNS